MATKIATHYFEYGPHKHFRGNTHLVEIETYGASPSVGQQEQLIMQKAVLHLRVFVVRMSITFLLAMLGLNAQALNYTNDCEDQLTATDRQLFEAAFRLVDDYQHSVESHINDARLLGNPDNYSFIGPETMEDWRGRVDKMASGNIKVACKYNATSNSCRNNPGRLGRTFSIDPLVSLRDRIVVCIDNVRQTVSTPGQPTEQLALLTGTIAHELMHHVDDGYGAHGPGGITNPQNPVTPSETIGVAMEHLVLTPDLSVTVDGLTSVAIADFHYLGIDVRVTNVNPNALIGVLPISGRGRNLQSTFTVDVDGGTTCTLPVPPLNALAATVLQCNATAPAYIPAADPERTIVAVADALNVMVESNESNNTERLTFDTEADLAVSVEVAAPPVCQHLDFSEVDELSGPYAHWLEIPYLVNVTNLHRETHSPSVDLVMAYDDMWTWTMRYAQQEIMLPPIGPQETHAEVFVLNVPTDAGCTGPGILEQDIVHVDFIADWNDLSMFDSDRGNNYVSITVDQDYWRPDYVLREVDLLGSVPTATRDLSFAVRNIGPAAEGSGTSIAISRTLVTDAGGLEVYSGITGDLAPGAQRTYVVPVTVDACDPVYYSIEADHFDVIDEFDESNNAADISIEPHNMSGVPISGEPWGGSVSCHERELQQLENMLEDEGMDPMDHKLEGLSYEQWGTDRRGANEDIGPGAPILDRLNE